jgi:hypothetical protein
MKAGNTSTTPATSGRCRAGRPQARHATARGVKPARHWPWNRWRRQHRAVPPRLPTQRLDGRRRARTSPSHGVAGFSGADPRIGTCPRTHGTCGSSSARLRLGHAPASKPASQCSHSGAGEMVRPHTEPSGPVSCVYRPESAGPRSRFRSGPAPRRRPAFPAGRRDSNGASGPGHSYTVYTSMSQQVEDPPMRPAGASTDQARFAALPRRGPGLSASVRQKPTMYRINLAKHKR